jgi:hypothetical protein
MGSKLCFRLHYQDALTLAAEISPQEQYRYVRQLTTLERGSAVVRLGTDRPVIMTIPDHRAATPTREELARLREASAGRHTRSRAEVRRQHDAGPSAERPAPSSERGNEIASSEHV